MKRYVKNKKPVSIRVVINDETFIIPKKGKKKELPYYKEIPLDIKALVKKGIITVEEA